jgi:hypothetical protein
MCSRAIRVWVCAYRVLLAAVDEVELDEENREVTKFVDIVGSECAWRGYFYPTLAWQWSGS